MKSLKKLHFRKGNILNYCTTYLVSLLFSFSFVPVVFIVISRVESVSDGKTSETSDSAPTQPLVTKYKSPTVTLQHWTPHTKTSVQYLQRAMCQTLGTVCSVIFAVLCAVFAAHLVLESWCSVFFLLLFDLPALASSPLMPSGSSAADCCTSHAETTNTHFTVTNCEEGELRVLQTVDCMYVFLMMLMFFTATVHWGTRFSGCGAFWNDAVTMLAGPQNSRLIVYTLTDLQSLLWNFVLTFLQNVDMRMWREG